MPRSSADEIAAAVWREGGRHPQPPKHLARDARAVWREIVESRPVDFFAPGSLHLLEQFCVTVIAQRHISARLQADPGDLETAKLHKEYGTLSATLATKLRLSIQSALRTESGKNSERAPALGGLLGGEAWHDGGKRAN